eukprot:13834934-Ditylum_brightwellii.AAC.1
MLADFFTKPLAGALFHRFREVIMGYKPIMALHDVHSVSDKECVVKRDFQNVLEKQMSQKTPKMLWADVVICNDRQGHDK